MEASRIENLELQIAQHERQLQELRRELARLKSSSGAASPSNAQDQHNSSPNPAIAREWRWPLAAEEYRRYGRQLILPEIGLQGQTCLKSASVLIVGLGGLGCPAAAYLAGAGVGTLGLMDGDAVELSNLHRQILHTSERVGMLKVESARDSLHALNPLVTYTLHPTHLSPATALAAFAPYDLILDCTDTPATRYLVSDAAVLAGKPLVSASALRTDGQLLVLNHPPTPPPAQRKDGGSASAGPCYRCVFPVPPPADAVLSCGEGGILGPVVGVMGVLMALEAVKVLVSRGDGVPASQAEMERSSSAGPGDRQGREHSMLVFSAAASPPSRSVRLKGKRPGCAACSERATVTAEALASGALDHVAFCGLRNPIRVLDRTDRVSAKDLGALVNGTSAGRDGAGGTGDENYVLVDVRDEVQFGLCSLEDSVNVPWTSIQRMTSGSQHMPNGHREPPPNDEAVESDPLVALRKAVRDKDTYVICRYGNDSQLAVQKLKALGLDAGGSGKIRDVSGGFRAWKRTVDPDWPEY